MATIYMVTETIIDESIRETTDNAEKAILAFSVMVQRRVNEPSLVSLVRLIRRRDMTSKKHGHYFSDFVLASVRFDK